MKVLGHCAKLRLHNCNYFSSFSKVFAKAGTFFLSIEPSLIIGASFIDFQ